CGLAPRHDCRVVRACRSSDWGGCERVVGGAKLADGGDYHCCAWPPCRYRTTYDSLSDCAFCDWVDRDCVTLPGGGSGTPCRILYRCGIYDRRATMVNSVAACAAEYPERPDGGVCRSSCRSSTVDCRAWLSLFI